ncbi:hypothetical protein SAY87_004300 [Trapa incisa]|uniref:EF-hand domain-containing protein n=1 Tax=Trapa incisa TaxID=236973 RepID=A0AAN7JRT3_9MYRT|nr:hypothetical protein SAY87_004300 [Trapa incisa]
MNSQTREAMSVALVVNRQIKLSDPAVGSNGANIAFSSTSLYLSRIPFLVLERSSLLPLSISRRRDTGIMSETPTSVNAGADCNSLSSHVQCMTDAELQKVFDQFDANGDGKISSDELLKVLSAMGSLTAPDDIQRAMEEIDTDHDGFISLEEFSALCRSTSGESDLHDAFDLYDQDKNGLISASELHLVLNRLNMGCSLEDCVRMINSVDSDGDGNVNYDEFKKMMTGSIANCSSA